MVSPIILIAAALGFAILFPLFEKIGRKFAALLGALVMAGFTVLGITWLLSILAGGPIIEVQTAGFNAPLSINLAIGTSEALVIILVNFLGFLSIIYQTMTAVRKWEGRQVILFFVMILGANGLILTRDLFNVFVFLEITSISLFGLLSTSRDTRSFEAGFKYMIAGGLASAFYLIGIAFLYRITGTLNIDTMLGSSAGIFAGLTGFLAMVFFITAIIIELKPALANGWALDTYEAADPGIAALLSSILTSAILMVLIKVLPLLKHAASSLVPVLGLIGGTGFLISSFMAMNQKSAKRMLGYSSVSQTALILLVLTSVPASAVSIPGLSAPAATSPIILASIILLANHALAKSALFWVTGILKPGTRKAKSTAGGRDAEVPGSAMDGAKSTAGGRDAEVPLPETLKARSKYLFIIGICIFALVGLPPFPAFWIKWNILSSLVSANNWFPVLAILIGSLLEAAYLFKWFLSLAGSAEDNGNTSGEEVPGDFDNEKITQKPVANIPVPNSAFLLPGAAAFVLAALGLWMALVWDVSLWILAPLAGLIGFVLLDIIRIPQKIQVFLAIALLAAFGYASLYMGEQSLKGIPMIFMLMFLGGTAIQLIAFFTRKGRGDGTMALVIGLCGSLAALVLAENALELFFGWEMMTVTSFLLIMKGKKARAGAYRYILFSLFSAYCLLVALLMLPSFRGLWSPAPGFKSVPVIVPVLFALAALIKLGSIGVHLWLPSSYAEAPDDVSSLFSSVMSKAGLFILFLTAGVLLTPLVPALSSTGLDGIPVSSVLGWIGVITALAGAMMALFQEDIKYTLAYSSMSQVGYMLLALSLVTHLGYVTSLYLAVTHLMFKGMLWLAVLGVIQRTGTRLMYKMGGLIKTMPWSFISVLFAIIAVSGVPPLSGFGGKWLLYTALIEKKWYLQAGVAMFSSGVAFLYLYRLIHSIFLGQPKDEFAKVKEAPIVQLIPQFIFMAGIMAVSMFPGVLLKPLQEAVIPLFASTLDWDGYEVISSLGYWNGNAVMYVTMGVFGIPFIWLLIMNGKKVRTVKQFNIVYASERPFKPVATHYAFNFFAHYRKALGFLITPWPTRFRKGVAGAVDSIGAVLRRWNTGNPQTYGFQILLFLFIVFLAGRGGV